MTLGCRLKRTALRSSELVCGADAVSAVQRYKQVQALPCAAILSSQVLQIISFCVRCQHFCTAMPALLPVQNDNIVCMQRDLLCLSSTLKRSAQGVKHVSLYIVFA